VSKEKEWLKDKVVHYSYCNTPEGCACSGACNRPDGWMYKVDYNKFKEEHKIEPMYAWKNIPINLKITKQITKLYETNN
jgi:hypothetical protein